MRGITTVAIMTIREIFAEKLFYLLVVFALAIVGIGHLLGQMTYAEQAKLTTDFMLGGIEICMALFSTFMAQFLYQRELTSGSIFLVLSKPIGRTRYLLGKFLGQSLVQLGLMGILYLMLFASCYRLMPYFSPKATLQCLIVILFQTTLLSAIAYCFAILSKGILPFLATMTLFLVGRFYPTLKQAMTGIAVIVPNFSLLNTKSLASYGMLLPISELSWLLSYTFICSSFYFLVALILFNHKDLQP